MYYERRYLQFNNLVFDGMDMLSSYDTNISFKGSSTDYSYGHGSYRPFKSNYIYVDEQTVTMTLTFRMKKLYCDHRPFYLRFVKDELSRPGKLWAVENNELIWANAVVTSFSPNYSRQEDKAVYDVSFAVPGGVWHKADKQRTFLVPYDICTFMDCMDYRILQPCSEVDCCTECQRSKEGPYEDCYCCCADGVTENMMLCHHLDELQNFYGCDTPFQIVYDCASAEKFSKEPFLGQKICTEDICEDSVIAGRFYSETDIPTEDVTIIIKGTMYNPWITINGNTNIIEGEYDGALIIKSSGDVYYQHGCCEDLLDPSVWIVPSDMTYGWTVNPGSNSIIVNLNRCCNGITCVYIQHEAITM